MGALRMRLEEHELKPLVDAWRDAIPMVVQFWYDIEQAAITTTSNLVQATTRDLLTHAMQHVDVAGHRIASCTFATRSSSTNPPAEHP